MSSSPRPTEPPGARLLRAGICARGHTLSTLADLIELPDGMRCARCVADAAAERAGLRGRF